MDQVLSFLMEHDFNEQGNAVSGKSSLTVIADNCSGQNENNSILRLAAWLVESGCFEKVTIIFMSLATQRMNVTTLAISLKKIHKQNLHTLSQFPEVTNQQENVTVVEAPRTKCLDTFFCHMFETGTMLKNHVFWVEKDAPMTMQTSNWTHT